MVHHRVSQSLNRFNKYSLVPSIRRLFNRTTQRRCSLLNPKKRLRTQSRGRHPPRLVSLLLQVLV